MSKLQPTPRRVRVERNIYKRGDGAFEVGFRDGSGKQRWRTVPGGIQAARALRNDLLARRNRGDQVAANPRLRFSEAADCWLDGPVMDLREQTRNSYRWAVDRHLRRRFATRRVDAVTADDLAGLVRELRDEGLTDPTIGKVLGVVNRIYRYATRRLGYAGPNPQTQLLRTERPRMSAARPRRIFLGTELEETITAAGEPYRTMFILAALTGARVSELIALTWADVQLDDLEDATVAFVRQLDRKGNVSPSKTERSARSVPVPRELALILARHKLACRDGRPEAFVFATSTGRSIGQRNVSRALQAAQRRAHTKEGRPTFPQLHGGSPKPHRGSLPSMHSFRHTVATRALLAGESVDEVAFLLGHVNANVTRAVYTHEVNDARRRAFRRSAMVAEYKHAIEAAGTPCVRQDTPMKIEEVLEIRSGS